MTPKTSPFWICQNRIRGQVLIRGSFQNPLIWGWTVNSSPAVGIKAYTKDPTVPFVIGFSRVLPTLSGANQR
jgi:hypothetical protein